MKVRWKPDAYVAGTASRRLQVYRGYAGGRHVWYWDAYIPGLKRSVGRSGTPEAAMRAAERALQRMKEGRDGE